MARPLKHDWTKLLFNVFSEDGMKAVLSAIDCHDLIIRYGEAAIRYLVSLYDRNSPVVLRHGSIAERKREAFEVSGIDPSKKEEFYNLSSPVMVDFLCAYSRLQQNNIWVLVIASEQFFYECYKNSLSPLVKGDEMDDNDFLAALQKKSKLLEEMDKTRDRISRCYGELFPADKVAAAAVAKTARVTPEAVALSLS